MPLLYHTLPKVYLIIFPKKAIARMNSENLKARLRDNENHTKREF